MLEITKQFSKHLDVWKDITLFTLFFWILSRSTWFSINLTNIHFDFFFFFQLLKNNRKRLVKCLMM